MVEEVFAFAEECEVFLRILEAVTDMRFGFTPARTEPVEQLAEPRTLALAGREKPERKDCTTAIVMSEPLKQIHFGHEDGISVIATISPVFFRRSNSAEVVYRYSPSSPAFGARVVRMGTFAA